MGRLYRQPTVLPRAVNTYLRRCLQKEPRQRVRDIGDVRLALEGLFEIESDGHESAIAPRLQIWQRPVPAAIAGVALLLVGAGVSSILSGIERQLSAPTTRFTLTLPASETLSSGMGTVVALSPDGSTLVYGAIRDGIQQLYRRPLGEFVATAIAGTEGGREPVISPDGESVIFRVALIAENTPLRKVPLRGGPVQTLTELGVVNK